MMCLGVFLWVQLLWSELPGLPGSLFLLPDWVSSPSLFFQISFQFLALPLGVGMFKVLLEVPNLSSFFEFLFLHSVLVECFFLPSGPHC